MKEYKIGIDCDESYCGDKCPQLQFGLSERKARCILFDCKLVIRAINLDGEGLFYRCEACECFTLNNKVDEKQA